MTASAHLKDDQGHPAQTLARDDMTAKTLSVTDAKSENITEHDDHLNAKEGNSVKQEGHQKGQHAFA